MVVLYKLTELCSGPPALAEGHFFLPSCLRPCCTFLHSTLLLLYLSLQAQALLGQTRGVVPHCVTFPVPNTTWHTTGAQLLGV